MRSGRDPDAEEGAVAVEFALVLTVLMMLLLGILSFGLQFGTRILAVQAASEGARAAVAGLSDAERQSLAAAAITATLDSYGGIATARTVSVAVAGSPTSSVRVSVTLDLSRFQLSRFARLVPVMTSQPTAVVTARVGGF
jgi:Flp pilus assembly protein TadG